MLWRILRTSERFYDFVRACLECTRRVWCTCRTVSRDYCTPHRLFFLLQPSRTPRTGIFLERENRVYCNIRAGALLRAKSVRGEADNHIMTPHTGNPWSLVRRHVHPGANFRNPFWSHTLSEAQAPGIESCKSHRQPIDVISYRVSHMLP